MESVTRRAMLARAAAALAVAAAAGPSRAAAPRAIRVSVAGALTSGRRHRYAELVAAVAALEGGRASPRYVERATAAFSGWYSRNHGLRPMADHVLDEVAAAGGARSLLTDLAADGDARRDRRFGTRGARRQILATQARQMASPPFAPDRA